MGTHFDTSYLSVGQIELLSENRQASIALYLPHPMDVSIIVLDSIGRSRFENKYALGEGFQDTEIHLPHLPEGSYNAWIELGGQTFLRTFQVEAPAEEPDWFDKMKGWFS